MYDLISTKSIIENTLKSLPYVKEHHLQKVESRSTRSFSHKSDNYKLRVWIVENKYVANLLMGNPKIENILNEIRKQHSFTYDIFFV